MIVALFSQTLNWKDLLARKFRPTFVPTIVSTTDVHLVGFESMYVLLLGCDTCKTNLISNWDDIAALKLMLTQKCYKC